MTTYRDESGPGDTTTWLHDPATGVLVQKLYEDGKGPTYTYTPDGKLATRTWARGVTTTYTYDGWGNLTNIVHSDGTPSVSMAYDVMGRQIETTDAAGVTTFAYDSFSSLTNETVAGQYAKSLDRYYDEYGRNVGYSLDGQRRQTVAYDPATGRIATMDGFAWQYLPGTDLKQSLVYPGGAVAEWVYEPRRDLLTLVSNDVFSAYAYENDAAGRRISKNTERYGYNVRGELIVATNTATAAHYAYAFDTIGNRIVAEELGTNSAYSANALNQYTNIVAEAVFKPEFDDDGNQTLVKTSTGIWQVTYNAENRPVVWSNGTAVVTMDYDRMGRRVWYASVSGTQTNAFAKFVYDGYLCVQQLDGLSGDVDQEFVWDPSETVATRPLVWSLPANNRTFHYFHDGNKNVSDVIDASDGSLAAHYDYAPFGAVVESSGPFAAMNSYRFSSEYHDLALGCVYYNYRHYNPLDGRWASRDLIGDIGGHNLLAFVVNRPVSSLDIFGLITLPFQKCIPSGEEVWVDPDWKYVGIFPSYFIDVNSGGFAPSGSASSGIVLADAITYRWIRSFKRKYICCCDKVKWAEGVKGYTYTVNRLVEFQEAPTTWPPVHINPANIGELFGLAAGALLTYPGVPGDPTALIPNPEGEPTSDTEGSVIKGPDTPWAFCWW